MRSQPGTDLAGRLRQLREQTESDSAREAPSSPQQPRETQTSALPQPQSYSAKTAGSIPPPDSAAPSWSNGLADDDGILQTDDDFLEDLLNEEAALGHQLSLDTRAELDSLHELARQFSLLTAAGNKETKQKGDDDDDSNGDEMTREVEEIVSKAVTETKLALEPKGDDPNLIAVVGTELDTAGDDTALSSKDGEQPELSLPSVPTDMPSPTASPSAKSAVPMTGDFEDDMARRMAALRNFKLSIGGQDEESNPLGLPSVPTFQPSEVEKRKAGPGGRVGFTDDDMKTWCVVCLEDGTLICPECDDDVYCSQCWFDMHKGPAAGFAEQSHRALQFNKDQKKKKVAIGA